jgi:hypothetical protein
LVQINYKDLQFTENRWTKTYCWLLCSGEILSILKVHHILPLKWNHKVRTEQGWPATKLEVDFFALWKKEVCLIFPLYLLESILWLKKFLKTLVTLMSKGITYAIYIRGQQTMAQRWNASLCFFVYIRFFFSCFCCCAGWGCIVVFTKVLIIYQILHTWIHPLHHSSLFFHPPTPGVVSVGILFLFTNMCTRYLHYIHLHHSSAIDICFMAIFVLQW